MPRRRSRRITELELEILQVIWELEEATSEEVLATLNKKGRELTGGSVRKMLSIMERKGQLQKRPSGRGKAFLYRASVPQEKTKRKLVLELSKRAFGGSAALMVSTLLGSRALDDKELDKIQRLIAKRRKEKDDERD